MQKFKLVAVLICAIQISTQVWSQDFDQLNDKWIIEMMAQAEKDALRNYGPVVVKKLSVNITIDTSGFFDVEENYDVYFNESRHGILRFLKLKYLLDIKETSPQEKSFSEKLGNFFFPPADSRRICISNIDVPGKDFEVSGNNFINDQVEIKIGHPDIYVEELQHYTIKYRVENAFLFRDSIIDFYWNFLGGNWDMKFLDVDFKIMLQGGIELPENRYYLYGGDVGNTNPLEGLQYNNDTLSGTSPFILNENQDLTVLIHLPANYVPRPTQSEIFWSQYAWPLVPFATILIFFVVWYFVGRDKFLVRQVEYNPPKGVDPAMAGFLVDSKSNNRDLIALLPYWASMGIITMEEKTKKNIFGATFRKIIFYAILLINLAAIITFSIFLYLENEIGYLLIPYFFLLIIVGPIVWRPIKRMRTVPKEMDIIKLKEIDYAPQKYERTIFTGLFKGNQKRVSLSSLKEVFYKPLEEAKTELKEIGLKHGYTKTSERNVRIAKFILVVAMIVGVFYLFVYFHVLAAFVHILTCAILIYKSRIMDKRTSSGDQLLKEVLGFKRFIEKADKPKLKFLLAEDPKYYEKTIGYAVAFGMADKWCKKFNGLVPPPTWYQSTNDSNDSFGQSFNHMIATAAVVMSVSPPSSGSGGGSSFGGGSSGGGFGGGGGSSW